MIFSISRCSFVKYKNDSRRVLHIPTKLPQPVYPSIVQASAPVDVTQDIFYFEVTLKDVGQRKLITIGFSEKDAVLNKQLGSSKGSYGFRADGKVFHNKEKGDDFLGSKFDVRDTVGCGLLLTNRLIFFTLNGRFLGYAFTRVDLKEPLYPSVCLQSYKEEIESNFG